MTLLDKQLTKIVDNMDELQKPIFSNDELIEELKRGRFMPDGKTPKCQYCKNAMKNYIPKHGRFKGQVQKYEWICDCPRYPKDLVLSVG